MRFIWQRSRMIAIAVVIVLGAGVPLLSLEPHAISDPCWERSGNAAALRSSSPAITAETEP